MKRFLSLLLLGLMVLMIPFGVSTITHEKHGRPENITINIVAREEPHEVCAPVFYGRALPSEAVKPEDPENQGVVLDEDIDGCPTKIWLPSDYDPQANYNILVLLYGDQGSNYDWMQKRHEMWYGVPFSNTDIYDQLHARGLVEDFIVVAPNYTMWSGHNGHTTFAQGLRDIILPYVADHYATYAKSGSYEDLVKAREHVMFGGGSLGAEYVWGGMSEILPVCANFLPMSGFTNITQVMKEIHEKEKQFPINMVYYTYGSMELTEMPRTYRAFVEEFPNVPNEELVVEGTHHSHHTWAVGIWDAVQTVWPAA